MSNLHDIVDIDLLAMVLRDDLEDYGVAYEPVDVPGSGSSVVRKYRQVLELPELSLSPAGANPRNIVGSGVQNPLAVWVLSLPRGTTLVPNWLVKATIMMNECTTDTWLDVIGPEHPRSHEVLSRWLCATVYSVPEIIT